MRVGRVRTLPGWRHGAEVAEALLWGAGCGAFLACPGTFCKGGVCSVWPAHWIHRGCFKLKLDGKKVILQRLYTYSFMNRAYLCPV